MPIEVKMCSDGIDIAPSKIESFPRTKDLLHVLMEHGPLTTRALSERFGWEICPEKLERRLQSMAINEFVVGASECDVYLWDAHPSMFSAWISEKRGGVR